MDNSQDNIFGGFAPNSQTADVLSKAIGSFVVIKTRTYPIKTKLCLSRQSSQSVHPMSDYKRSFAYELPQRARAVYMYLKDRTGAKSDCWPAVNNYRQR